MGRWTPVRQNARLGTRLEAAIETGDRRLAATVLSLSEGGFYCVGFDLDQVADVFHLEITLAAAGTEWSPNPSVAGWRSRMAAGALAYPLRAESELLHVDLADRGEEIEGRVGIGARFRGLTGRGLDELRDYIAREIFRATEWRTVGGAVPAERLSSDGPAR